MNITGVGNSGDFVLNSQEIAKDQGFNHVSKLWYDKTKSFEDGLEQLEDSRGMREDLLVKLRDINFSVSQQGKFVVGYVGTHGLAQGLDVILDAAERLQKNSDIQTGDMIITNQLMEAGEGVLVNIL